jgi:hypothetical protein
MKCVELSPVSARTAAAVLGVSERTLTRLIGEGAPRRRDRRFALGHLVPWYVERERGAAPSELREELTRKRIENVTIRNEAARRELDREKGLWVSKADVEAATVRKNRLLIAGLTAFCNRLEGCFGLDPVALAARAHDELCHMGEIFQDNDPERLFEAWIHEPIFTRGTGGVAPAGGGDRQAAGNVSPSVSAGPGARDPEAGPPDPCDRGPAPAEDPGEAGEGVKP